MHNKLYLSVSGNRQRYFKSTIQLFIVIVVLLYACNSRQPERIENYTGLQSKVILKKEYRKIIDLFIRDFKVPSDELLFFNTISTIKNQDTCYQSMILSFGKCTGIEGYNMFSIVNYHPVLIRNADCSIEPMLVPDRFYNPGCLNDNPALLITDSCGVISTRRIF